MIELIYWVLIYKNQWKIICWTLEYLTKYNWDKNIHNLSNEIIQIKENQVSFQLSMSTWDNDDFNGSIFSYFSKNPCWKMSLWFYADTFPITRKHLQRFISLILSTHYESTFGKFVLFLRFFIPQKVVLSFKPNQLQVKWFQPTAQSRELFGFYFDKYRAT